MAYALGLPKDVTDRIYSMRDWRWEMVRDGGKTPSAKCFRCNIPFWDDVLEELEQPAIGAWHQQEFEVMTDSEDSELGQHGQRGFGGEVLELGGWPNDVYIDVFDPARRIAHMIGNWPTRRERGIRRFELQKNGGKQPRKLKALQKKQETSTAEMWWQCEPCQQ